MPDYPPKVHGSPEKGFFIHNITKDITLQDCVLDLLDNCIDGANRIISQQQSQNSSDNSLYEGYKAEISFDSTLFLITDNCGGIPVHNAVEYAFHFGRPPDAPPLPEHSIGLYGIGMKRAIFKIGKLIEVTSSTSDEAFRVPINVPLWEPDREDWDFDLEEDRVWEEPGTKIEIADLNESVADEFEDEVFAIGLKTTIARDYSIFLQSGFQVVVNGESISPYEYRLRESAEFLPVNTEYIDTEDREVTVSIKAGMAALPPDDDSAEAPQPPEVVYYGWFVACNSRIVLAGDKSDRTVWGNGTFPAWHNQYNGFMGIVDFVSLDPSKLPWTTTKRDLDQTNPVYRRALVKMKEFTREFIDYTNRRKADIERAKEIERRTTAKLLSELPTRMEISMPQITPRPRVRMATIQYQKPEAQVKRAAEVLGDRFMYNKEVGIKTFEYFWENEVEE